MEVDRSLEVQAGADGPRLVRRAHTELGRARLAREARRLEQARHPGVVELLAATDDELTLAWAGAETLELAHPTVLGVAATIASLASTVADLHGLGLVHGRLEPAHVIVGADGRPRLCGLRGVDPDERVPHPADDVAAIGALLDRLVGPSAEVEPIPERRWARRRLTGFHRRALQTLADTATDPDPAARPTARALAAAITEAVPEAAFEISTLPAPPAPAPAEPEPEPEPEPPTPPPAPAPVRRTVAARPLIEPPADPDPAPEPDAEAPTPTPDADVGRVFLGLRVDECLGLDDEPADGRRSALGREFDGWRAGRRPRGLAAGAVAAAVGTVAVVALLAGVVPGRSHPDRPAEAQVAAAPAPTAGSTPAATGPTAPPAARCAAGGADVDGDGCADPVRVDGSSVEAFGRRYLVGQAGDAVAVADWDCDGVATIAVVRPATGEIFVFADWRVDDGQTTVPALAAVDRATQLLPPAPGSSPASCPARVRRRDGSTVPVDLTGGS